jgi:hypothetical protein
MYPLDCWGFSTIVIMTKMTKLGWLVGGRAVISTTRHDVDQVVGLIGGVFFASSP